MKNRLNDRRVDMGDSVISQVYKVEEVATILNVSSMTIYRMLESGDLPGIKLGSTWRISKKIIDDWLDGKQYVQQIDSNIKKRRWTKEELNQFVQEDQLD
jgi:excisionase family DNA binding protein